MFAWLSVNRQKKLKKGNQNKCSLQLGIPELLRLAFSFTQKRIISFGKLVRRIKQAMEIWADFVWKSLPK